MNVDILPIMEEFLAVPPGDVQILLNPKPCSLSNYWLKEKEAKEVCTSGLKPMLALRNKSRLNVVEDIKNT